MEIRNKLGFMGQGTESYKIFELEDILEDFPVPLI